MAKRERAPVAVRIEGGVGTITLDEPERMNVFHLTMANAVFGALERFREDESVRAVVLQGAGRAFSAGGDVREMHGNVRDGDRAAFFRVPLKTFNELGKALQELPLPVVAALHGAVAGVAFNLALACDFRIAQEGTRFTQAFVRLGLSPDGGGSWQLARLVGHARACELTMLPTVIDAEQALAWGLLNRVVPAEGFDDAVRELAEELARGPTATLARTKALLHSAWSRSFVEQAEAERKVQIANAATHDFEEGLSAFVGKRRPDFRGE